MPADIIRRTNAANHLDNAWAKFERAEIDIETFDRLFAEESLALGAEVRGKDVLPLLSGDLRPEMVEALKRVKTRFKTGCITNNLPANAIGSASGRSLYIAEVMVLFDHVIESARIGLRKPDLGRFDDMIEQHHHLGDIERPAAGAADRVVGKVVGDASGLEPRLDAPERLDHFGPQVARQ